MGDGVFEHLVPDLDDGYAGRKSSSSSSSSFPSSSSPTFSPSPLYHWSPSDGVNAPAGGSDALVLLKPIEEEKDVCRLEVNVAVQRQDISVVGATINRIRNFLSVRGEKEECDRLIY